MLRVHELVVKRHRMHHQLIICEGVVCQKLTLLILIQL